jgi:hypothetical protein
LLRRIEADPATDQNSPTQESHHATAATGAVECRTPSHSTRLSTAHASAAEQSGQPPGPAHSQTDPGSSHNLCSLNPTQTP